MDGSGADTVAHEPPQPGKSIALLDRHTSSAPPVGRTFADRYVLRQPLGRGSMGSVWLAEDERLQRQVAVKLLASAWAESEDALRRFRREAMTVAKLHSPHVVQIFDYGVEGDRPYIVMELLNGEDLQTRLKRCGRLSLQETANIVLQTCRGLYAAHKAGLVHRDLKPGNIMFDTSSGHELVKVLDFGVAKAEVDSETEATKAGTLLGTPQYMAPEQARAMPDVDYRADLWSVGVIAYRALTGKSPFRAKSVSDLIVKICTVAPRKATELCTELPPEVDTFFARALVRDRGKRFASARELASSFFRLLGPGVPSSSMSPLDTGRFEALSPDLMSDSFPFSESSASLTVDESEELLQTLPTVARPRPAAGGDEGPAAVPAPPQATATVGDKSAEPLAAAADAPPPYTDVGAVLQSDLRSRRLRRRLVIAAVATVVAALALTARIISRSSSASHGHAGAEHTAGAREQAEPTRVAHSATPPTTALARGPATTSAPAATMVTSSPASTRASATPAPAAKPAPHASSRVARPPRRPHTAGTAKPKLPPPNNPPDDLLGERY